ncbi:MAG: ribonuclease HII [Verrucomicrobia bacterium]|nr:ribonuclease HII [Verrucomicrobiota bacterium]NBS49505.1 ribonuclease HII [Verrucomicrobiota bacterium]NBS79074.1 ribonuclease HII [bacterium]NBT24159.1 ribonuclease HII [bacterium]NBV97111.1 ribonuclease HII [Verrucomicrobiota bacterium]
MPPLWKTESSLAGKSAAVGVDEAGRGALAGPVVAAAYMFLREKIEIPGLDDSKKLTRTRREDLFQLLTNGKVGRWGVGEASIEEIEKHNILVASQIAMGRALEALGDAEGVVLVDGLPAKHLGREHVAVKGGDGKCPSIAAASIVAKVSRDRTLLRFGELYPVYGFSSNCGYGTAKHLRALQDHGPCPIHRRSFLPVGSATLPGLDEHAKRR